MGGGKFVNRIHLKPYNYEKIYFEYRDDVQRSVICRMQQVRRAILHQSQAQPYEVFDWDVYHQREPMSW